MSQSIDASYRRQAHAGFAALRFDEPIEAEFRSYYRARNRGFVRIAAALAVTLLGLSMLLDGQLLDGGAFAAAAYLKLAMALPLVLLLLASYPGALRRYDRALALGSAAALCAGTIALPMLTGAAGLDRLLAAPLVTMFVYLMLGLRLLPALWCAAPLAAVLIWVETNGAGGMAASAYDAFFLVFMNVIGAFACYRLELTARSTFLERQIVSILGGSDAATGIPNRRFFNAQLQSVRRQSQRESKPLAVALIEIVDFERYRLALGRQESDRVMRRVAHSVARSARRPLDFAARFADGELALVLYDPNEPHLHALLKQVREQIALLDIEAPEQRALTVLIGAAWREAGGTQECDVLLECANRALDEARGLDGLGIAILPAVASARDSQIMRGPWTSAAEEG